MMLLFTTSSRHLCRRRSKSIRLFSSSNTSSSHKDVIDFRPKRIILLRHGQSLGNVDESAYVTTADWRIPLTDLGKDQAHEAGKQLRQVIKPDEKVVFYYSPYLRTQQTLDIIKPFFDKQQIIASLEEPRLSEQQIGNFQDVQEVLDAKAERSKFGRFYYRFPSGESGLDVYTRVSSFLPTFVRDCQQYDREHNLDNLNIVIVTHGLALRFFLMRWFMWSVSDFEQSKNPENCELITMNKVHGTQGNTWMELALKDRVSLDLPESCELPRSVNIHKLARLGVDDYIQIQREKTRAQWRVRYDAQFKDK